MPGAACSLIASAQAVEKSRLPIIDYGLEILSICLRGRNGYGGRPLMDPRFAHIRDWIFDLDNCLYPASTGLFALIDERMGAYIERLLSVDAAEAKRVQKAHFHEHGTTLAGLMKEQHVDPHDFLANVHDIPLDRLKADEHLAAVLARLPGRRFVFTNGDAPYAHRVLEAIGVHRHFDDLHDIHASSLRPKPDPHGYAVLCERFKIDPEHALLADDMVKNLAPAKALGMTTVWVDNGSEQAGRDYDEALVDVRVTDVGEWLESILGNEE
jgi:putative hydrolase of the HAD superfamily